MKKLQRTIKKCDSDSEDTVKRGAVGKCWHKKTTDGEKAKYTHQTNVWIEAHLDVFPVKLNPPGSHPQRKTPEKQQQDANREVQCLHINLRYSHHLFHRTSVTAYLDITSSAVAQPMAATMILYSPLPALRDITRWRPNRSARSTVAFMNSWKTSAHRLQPRVQAGIKCSLQDLTRWEKMFSFNTHPDKVINSSSSFPCGEKCS